MTPQPPSIKRPGLLGALALVSAAAVAAACLSLLAHADAAGARAAAPAETGAARAVQPR